MHANELDALIQTITERVLARLKSLARPTQPTQTLTVLWPVATAKRELICAAVSAFRAEGRRVQWVVAPELVGEVLPLLPAEEHARCHSLDPAPVQSILADLQGTDVVLVAAVHFQAARRLLSLEDEAAWIHILLQAHLAGLRIVICEDQLASRGLAAQNPVAQEARSLHRQLQQLGFRMLTADRLADHLKNMTLSYDHGLQSTRELLTEQDVENLALAGHRELRLHAKTLVTPLAESRATELGLRLLRMQDEET